MLQVKKGTQHIKKTPANEQFQYQISCEALKLRNHRVWQRSMALCKSKFLLIHLHNIFYDETFARTLNEFLPSVLNLTTEQRCKEPLRETYPFIATPVKSLLKVTLTQTRARKHFSHSSCSRKFVPSSLTQSNEQRMKTMKLKTKNKNVNTSQQFQKDEVFVRLQWQIILASDHFTIPLQIALIRKFNLGARCVNGS